jgi:hypothetical protein
MSWWGNYSVAEECKGHVLKPRLLFIPLHYDATLRPHEDWFNALSDVFDVMYFTNDLARRTLIQAFNPKYVLVQSGAADSDSVAYVKEYTGAKVIQWTGDARSSVMVNVHQYKGIADLTFLPSTGRF